MKKLISSALVALTLIPLVNSCGKSESGATTPKLEEPTAEAEARAEDESVDGSTIDGQYLAKFVTLNPQVNGTIPGSLTLYRNGDKLMTHLRLFAGKPKAWHMQGIYQGTRCPTPEDDTNTDGFIDINEAMAVVGKVIVPLDTNISSQTAGSAFYPLGDLSGYYHYERETSFDRMFQDLKAEDKNPNDHIAKLGPEEKFGFTGRVVMVQGIDELTLLPETVGTLNRRRPFQTLPITCGVIVRSDEMPGTIDNGEIPGPVAEVIEGQDRPAPDDVGTTAGETGGGTVAGTTGTNDTNDGEVGDEGGVIGGATTGGVAGGETGGVAGGTTGGTTDTEDDDDQDDQNDNDSEEEEENDDQDEDSQEDRPGRRQGGFIGGFIGGSAGGSTAGGSTSGVTGGGFIGGFVGGSSAGSASHQ